MTSEALRPDGSGDNSDERIERYCIESDEQPSAAVIRAVSSFTGLDPLSFEPLAYQIDPDALDAVFASGSPPLDWGSITFSFGGCEVTVEPDVIQVQRRDNDVGPYRSGDGQQ